MLRITVGRELCDDLEAVRAALSHQLPAGGLEAVLQVSAACPPRPRAAARGQGGNAARAARRTGRQRLTPVSAAVRREVFGPPEHSWRICEMLCILLLTAISRFRELHSRCPVRARASCAQRRRGSPRCTVGRGASPVSELVVSAHSVRIFARDHGRCTYVAPDGHVCGSTFQIELHHIVPFARGGKATADNIGLRCSVDNAYGAEGDYGHDHMARAIHEARASRQLTLM